MISTLHGTTRSAAWLLGTILLGLLQACGTTKTFNVSSAPDQALILRHGAEVRFDALWSYPAGTSPGKLRITFFGDQAQALTLIKRGFEPKTVLVSKLSGDTIHADMSRLSGVSDIVFDRGRLPTLPMSLLPVNLEVYRIRSLDESTAELAAVTTALTAGRPQTVWRALDTAASEQFRAQEPALRERLSRIRADRLLFEPRPVLANEVLKDFADLRTTTASAGSAALPDHFLYIGGRCNVDTAERIAKQASADVAGVLLQALTTVLARGGPMTPYQHHSQLANGPTTRLVAAMIDARSSEIVHVEQRRFGDCTNTEAFGAEVQKWAAQIGVDSTAP